jgi:hypothetical protein
VYVLHTLNKKNISTPTILTLKYPFAFKRGDGTTQWCHAIGKEYVKISDWADTKNNFQCIKTKHWLKTSLIDPNIRHIIESDLLTEEIHTSVSPDTQKAIQELYE